MTGETISNYRILEKIGAGGMGEVFLAEDISLGRKLALKILPKHFTQDPERVRRFEQEARAASALNHPNIITIYQIGLHEGAQYIATEYIEGETLRRFIRGKRMRPMEAVEIALQCAGALSAAHQAGIVHRDIKPENIMVRPDGYVKLLDFGLAKLTEAGRETQSLLMTQPGMVIGTVAYMSPEQARGLQVDSRTDIFSLGIVLYEMLTGSRPFAGDTPSDMIAALLVADPPPLSDHLTGGAEALGAIVSRMLVKERDDRFQTAQDVINDLKRVRLQLELSVQREEAGPSGPLTAVFDGKPGESIGEMETAMSYATNPAPVVTGYETTIPPSPDPRTAAVHAGESGITSPVNTTVDRPRRSRLLLPAAIIALLLISAAGIYLYRTIGGSRVDSIAVLPFAGSDGDTAYLGEGIAEDIIYALSQLPELSVTSRNAAIRYRGSEVDARRAGRELGVDAVLIGRLARRGNDLTINTELVRVSDGSQIWGERFVRRMSDLIAVQDEITWKITDRLKYRLSESQRQSIAGRGTQNSEAYELYLKGRYFWNQGTLESMKQADRYFEEAAAKDPEYALAAAGCAACHAAGTDEASPKEAMEKARMVAQAALNIDDTIVGAHLTLARVRLRYDWDFAAAEREFRRAIELDPRSAPAHQRYAEFLALMGRFDDAVREIGEARTLDPQSVAVNQTLGTLAFYERRFDSAIDLFRQGLTLDSGYSPAWARLGQIYDLRGETGNAVSALLEMKKLEGRKTVAQQLEEAFKAGGRVGFWRDYLRDLESEAGTKYVPSCDLAAVHLRLGQRDLAFAALDRAFESREGGIVELKVDPTFEDLRQAPRFQDLLRRAGLVK